LTDRVATHPITPEGADLQVPVGTRVLAVLGGSDPRLVLQVPIEEGLPKTPLSIVVVPEGGEVPERCHYLGTAPVSLKGSILDFGDEGRSPDRCYHVFRQDPVLLQPGDWIRCHIGEGEDAREVSGHIMLDEEQGPLLGTEGGELFPLPQDLALLEHRPGDRL